MSRRSDVNLERKVDAKAVHFTVTLDVVAAPVAMALIEGKVKALVRDFRAEIGGRSEKVVGHWCMREEEREAPVLGEDVEMRLRRGLGLPVEDDMIGGE